MCEKIKNKSLSVLTTPLKPALRLLQFGILVCVLLSTYVTHTTTTTTRHFFHFPPGWSANKRVGKVTRLSYPISSLPHTLSSCFISPGFRFQVQRHSHSILHQPWRFSAGEVSFFGLGGKDSGKRSGSAGEKKLSRLRKFLTSIHDPSH